MVRGPAKGTVVWWLQRQGECGSRAGTGAVASLTPSHCGFLQLLGIVSKDSQSVCHSIQIHSLEEGQEFSLGHTTSRGQGRKCPLWGRVSPANGWVPQIGRQFGCLSDKRGLTKIPHSKGLQHSQVSRIIVILPLFQRYPKSIPYCNGDFD